VINGETVLAVIPARGGSKKLPKKNKLHLAGKPLIVWTIESGLKSRCIDKMVVSSDDEEILEISKNVRRYGIIIKTKYTQWLGLRTLNIYTKKWKNQLLNFLTKNILHSKWYNSFQNIFNQ
tara:strand:+ start:426 stop:788 length:363 start_codon:yes stop_codon:yes gene_type:complete